MAELAAVLAAAKAGAFTVAAESAGAAAAAAAGGGAAAGVSTAGFGAALAGAAGGALATTAAVGSTVTGVGSAVSASNTAQAQAKQAQINASQIAGFNKIEAFREHRRTRARVGARNALTGASGVANTGTALSLIGDELFSGMLNEAIVLSQGGQAVTRQLASSSTSKQRARSSLTAGSIGAVAQGIQVGGSVRKLLV